MDTTPGAIVVAVGRRGSGAAVEYAAAEAVRHHRALHLVHAVGPDGAGPPMDGSEVLAAAVRHAGALLDGLAPVTATLAPGSPVDALVDAASRGGLVVVGRSPESRRTHPYTRSVTGGAGARVPVPVVSVPDEWEATGVASTVVVGVDEPDRATDVLATALAAAEERHARLVVLSTWWHAPAGRGVDPAWPQRLEDGIARSLAAVAPSYDVPVELHVRNARPGEALLDESRSAELVVLGRHTALVPGGSHLGPVALSVLRESGCPVLLAAPRLRGPAQATRTSTTPGTVRATTTASECSAGPDGPEISTTPSSTSTTQSV